MYSNRTDNSKKNPPWGRSSSRETLPRYMNNNYLQIVCTSATDGTVIGLGSDLLSLIGDDAYKAITDAGTNISWIGTGMGFLGAFYSGFTTGYETQTAVELTHTVHSYLSKERGVFMALYAEIAMKDMLDSGRVKISKDGKELIWRDEEARREFYDAIWEIKIEGCSE